MKSTITISRQMGSGGSYLGQVIATRLGFKYVDREVLRLAAQEFGCNEEEVAWRSERVSSFWEKIFSGLTFGGPDSIYSPPPTTNFSDEQLFEKQTEILRRIASKYDAVIVGWGAVHVLPRHPSMFNIFCHAPRSFRVKRVMRAYRNVDADIARALIEESDERRARFFAEMTHHDWTCANCYHLTIDTSLIPLDGLAEIIIGLMKARGGIHDSVH